MTATMQDGFDWNDLKVFLALHRMKRMTDAGRVLGVDQTTIARRVKALEAAIGTHLFVRRADGFELTKAGLRILPFALEIEHSGEKLHEQISGEDMRLAGRVRIGAPDGLGTFFLPAILTRFQRDNPEVDVEVVPSSRQFRVAEQEVHLALWLSLPESGRLLARKLADYNLHFFASPDYLERHGMPMSLADLQDHRLVGYIADMLFSPEVRFLEELGLRRLVRFASSSMAAQREAIREGAGLGILPRFMALNDPGLVPVLTDRYLLKRTVWIVSHQSTEDLARVRAVSEYLQRAARSRRDLLLLPQGA
ncbi:MAG: LysR family transcriptional regulator [Salipiger thiooxidans]|uniref:LysR family transcriptional regulator n=1 Tax=Salipiger thiooxidans TaxID=282683 RepID=UPI001CFAE807|nr:LysR family transcriptional regulator [Salipiger thiooxidans]